MRKLLLVFLSMVLLGCSVNSKEEQIVAEEGGKIISSMLYSPTLDIDWNYSVYLPPSYEKNEKKYPTVYFLHGAYGTHKDYHSMFDLKEEYEQMIEKDEVEEMILVFVDGFNSYYIDTESIPMETAIVNDLVPFINDQYRTDGRAEKQFITGLSMGGYGAIRFALKRPDIFSSAFLMSPGAWLEPSEDSSVRSRFHVFKDDQSNFSMEKWKKEHPVTVSKIKEEKPQIKIMSGSEDPVISPEDLKDFVEVLESKNLEVELDIVEGATHNWVFWEEATKEALIYFSNLLAD